MRGVIENCEDTGHGTLMKVVMEHCDDKCYGAW